MAGHAGFVRQFDSDLTAPGLRMPVTASAELFDEAVRLGRRVIWLHTFGERCVDASAGRPAGAPRLPGGDQPKVPAGGAIGFDAAGMPNTIDHDAPRARLVVGSGFIEPVAARVWHYEVGGKQVLVQWFNSRKREREKPQIGDRRKPSPLGDIQPDSWLAEYTTELLNVLNVLGLLVEMEPQAAALLERICAGPLISEADLRGEGVFFPAGHAPAASPAQQSFDL